MFPLYTLLRYYHAGRRFVAMIIEDGVWVMNETHRRSLYPCVQVWLMSLPGSPDISLLEIDSTLANQEEKREKERMEHAKQAVTKKAKKWNVPGKFNHPRSLTWARHIYMMIRECSKKCNNRLLENEEARLAYNHLVHVLTEFNDSIRTLVPFPRYRYTRGIDINDLPTMIHVLPNVTDDGMFHAAIRIAYQPLYVHLKYTVIPYMDEIKRQKEKEVDIAQYRAHRDRAVKKMMKLTEDYEKKASVLREKMERYQAYLDQLEGEKIET
jgi:hypothetical protein